MSTLGCPTIISHVYDQNFCWEGAGVVDGVGEEVTVNDV